MFNLSLDLNVLYDIIIPVLGIILTVIIHNTISSTINNSITRFWFSILIGLVLIFIAFAILNYSRSFILFSNPLAIAGFLLIFANIYSYFFGRLRLTLN